MISMLLSKQKGDNNMNTISNDKTRFLMTIDKEMKSQLEAIAKEENRSLNNLIIKVLSDYIKNRN